MAFLAHRYAVIHDLAKGADIVATDTQTAGTLQRVPELYYAGDSFSLALSVYDNYLGGVLADFGASATAKLYIKIADAADIPTELATGVISQAGENTEYSEVAFTVPSGATESYAGQSCLLYCVIEDSAEGGKVTISQPLNVSSLEGSGSGNPPASGMSYTPEADTTWPIVEPDDVAEALDLLSVPAMQDRCDSPSGTTELGKVYRRTATGWQAADPSDAVCKTCELWIAFGTDPTADGMSAEDVVTNEEWAFASIPGTRVWLAASGAITDTAPTYAVDAGNAARPVGWVRSATSVRFSGHMQSVTFAEADS